MWGKKVEILLAKCIISRLRRGTHSLRKLSRLREIFVVVLVCERE